MSDDFLLVGGIIAILGLVFAYRAWTSYQQSQRLTELAADEQTSGDTVEGPIEVSESAEPQRSPPNGVDDGSDGAPALWLWRVRRERKNTGSSRGNSTTWETVESGVAAGSFAIREEWNRINVDASSVTATARDGTGATMSENHSSGETFKAVDDPFDSDRFYVGEPEIDVPLGEPSLPQRLADEYLPFDLNVTLSLGRKTATPDRYQAAVVRDRDELLAHGSLDRSVEPPTLNGTDATPLVFVKDPASEGDTVP
ncbi:hypothetical protein [Natronoglomus mannanivorans]|uniref:Uncharacterized protein n=1 Tax=Natronoglomus mannanivorans TaxID=2979990 RepID=A0AAP3E334_9EURY|nr:hypothetical protein [Halobacteria archaeon AArc-xg1-1]